MAPRRGRDFWAHVVNEFEHSGLSHSEFAHGRRINVGTLRSWLYRLRREREGGIRVLPVHVPMAGATVTRGFVEIGVGGAVLRVGVGADAEYVAELVAKLRERC